VVRSRVAAGTGWSLEGVDLVGAALRSGVMGGSRMVVVPTSRVRRPAPGQGRSDLLGPTTDEHWLLDGAERVRRSFSGRAASPIKEESLGAHIVIDPNGAPDSGAGGGRRALRNTCARLPTAHHLLMRVRG
jgi:hypothetical protein